MFCTAGDRLAKAYPYRMAIDIPGVNSHHWPNLELAISRYSPLLSARASLYSEKFARRRSTESQPASTPVSNSK